ncbi:MULTISPECIES: hypothetical protein [Pseudomonas]|nr:MULTISPECIES: hypothetical protein [Pseudomonas]
MSMCIASAAKGENGQPLWVLYKDGRLYLSAATVSKAAITKAQIKT